MNKSVTLIACTLLAFTSCSKKSTVTCHNTVTVTDDSTTYTACGDGQMSSGQLIYGVVIAVYQVNPSVAIYANVNAPFSLSLQDSTGPIGGIGTYTLTAMDSNVNVYKENFTGGKSYKCSGGTITVAHIDTSTITGTFNITVFNTTESKAIHGSFISNL